MMSKGPARGYSQSRAFCGGTLMAGRSLILPTEKVPVVLQSLTRNQIAALPKDVFSVKVLGPDKTLGARGALEIARAMLPDHKMGIVVRGGSAIDGVMAMRGDTIMQGVKLMKGAPPGLVGMGKGGRSLSKLVAGGRRAAGGSLPVRVLDGMAGSAGGGGRDDDGEEKLVTILDIIGKAYTEVRDFRNGYRAKKKGNGGDGDDVPPDMGIFLDPINENEMADCTLQIKDSYFGSNDTCMISGQPCNLTDFCLLMFFAFGRMHLLKNLSRKPFCLFLQQKVFMDKKKPGVKNFNNYANRENYQSFEKKLPGLPFDLSILPSPNNGFHYLACHEIGRAFHNTDYFKLLRTQRTNLKSFEL